MVRRAAITVTLMILAIVPFFVCQEESAPVATPGSSLHQEVASDGSAAVLDVGKERRVPALERNKAAPAPFVGRRLGPQPAEKAEFLVLLRGSFTVVDHEGIE